MTYLKLSILSVSLAALLLGCSQSSNGNDPLVPEISSIAIEGANTIHAISISDDDLQLIGRIYYNDDTNATTYHELDWESNDTSVLTVHNGYLTPVGNGGIAGISASYRDEIYTTTDYEVTVIAVTDINISSDTLNITYDDTNASRSSADINSSDQSPWLLTINGTFTDLNTTTISSNIVWSSSNTSVIYVDSSNLMYYTPDVNTTVELNASFYDINATLDLNITVP